MKLERLIEQYIAFQQSLGTPFTTSAFILRAFGRACGVRASIASVRVQHVHAFLGKTRPVTETWFSKLGRLRSFFRYAVSRGYIETAPLPTVVPNRPSPFVPYIYTREELRHLLQVIDSHPQGRSTLEPVTIRTMILLYYGAGLRLREATNLTRADVDLNGSILTIRNTKFGKTRLVPVGSQLNRALVEYDRTRPRRRPQDTPFFTRQGSRPIHPIKFSQKFRFLCEHAGIRRTDTRERPRIHDLRHTFAVHRVTTWYQLGADVQRLLHHLSVYLGHSDLRHSQVYLSLTPELLAEANGRFERYAGKEVGRD